MRVLALEAYHGGSHKAFLDGWRSRSRHEWDVLGLPPFKWKWRMRHAGFTFAERLAPRVEAGETWDLLFASDMLNLPEFLGFAPPALRPLPSVLYFHENQLTYPDPHTKERDYHYGFTNLNSALAAAAVWFNSPYHREGFLEAVAAFVRKMPDHPPTAPVERIRAKAAVHPQGIEAFPAREGKRRAGPPRILWAARWEHDKNPEAFFEALDALRDRGRDFRLSVVGQSFRRTPAVFDEARERFAAHIDRWGYLESREDYRRALGEADVFVSTAIHEFFGISAAEAVAAGAYPLLPYRLAYPDLLADAPTEANPETEEDKRREAAEAAEAAEATGATGEAGARMATEAAEATGASMATGNERREAAGATEPAGATGATGAKNQGLALPPEIEEFYFGGEDPKTDARTLTERLDALCHRLETEGDLWRGDPNRARRRVERYFWDNLAPRLDEALETVRHVHLRHREERER